MMAGGSGAKMDISPTRVQKEKGVCMETCERVSWIEDMSYKLTKAHETPVGIARTPIGCLVTTKPIMTKESDLRRLPNFKKICHEMILIGHIGGKVYNVRDLLRSWAHQIGVERELEVKIDKNLVNGFVILKVGSRDVDEELVKLNPHHIQTKLLYLQHWLDDFKPEYPINVRHALWVKLFGVLLAYQDLKLLASILAPVGSVLSVEVGDGQGNPPSTWIACYLALFVPEIGIEGENGQVRKITLEYTNLDLRCWACRSTAHGYRTCLVGPYEGLEGVDFQCNVVFDNLGVTEIPQIEYPLRYNYGPNCLVQASGV